MNKEEFLRRAENPLCREQPVLYCVSVDAVSYDDCDGSAYDNAVVHTGVAEMYFLSLEDAQQAVAHTDFGALEMLMCMHLYRIIVRELPLGAHCTNGSYQRQWIYDAKRRLQAYQPISSLPDDYMTSFDRFYGLPDSCQRFKVGDVIEFVDYESRLRPCIVESVPLSPEKAWQHSSRGKEVIEDSDLDYSNRVYVVWYGPGEEDWDYLWEDNLMPASFPIPEDTLRLFNEYMNNKK